MYWITIYFKEKALKFRFFILKYLKVIPAWSVITGISHSSFQVQFALVEARFSHSSFQPQPNSVAAPFSCNLSQSQLVSAATRVSCNSFQPQLDLATTRVSSSSFQPQLGSFADCFSHSLSQSQLVSAAARFFICRCKDRYRILKNRTVWVGSYYKLVREQKNDS